ncbi:hypothetical protein [Gelidibacter japonicus]|uniref:hypothetical protein n=1 Tax=Gelidibacter japonicus TaxID=1962232 RepID=UPI003A8ED6EB
MKHVSLALALILSLHLCAQNSLEKTNAFVRVYDSLGQKISKGKVMSITDTSLFIRRKGKTVEIPATRISYLTTKRSPGHNILMGAVIGGTSMAIAGAAAATPGDGFIEWNAGEGLAAGLLVGGTAGAAIGGITVFFKNAVTYTINGNLDTWKAFKELPNP